MVPSRIILQALGLLEECLRLHQAFGDSQVTSLPSGSPSVRAYIDKGNAVLNATLVEPKLPRARGQASKGRGELFFYGCH